MRAKAPTKEREKPHEQRRRLLFLESQDLDEQERHKHADTMAQDIQIAIENYMDDEFGDEDVLAEQEANYNRMIGESLKR